MQLLAAICRCAWLCWRPPAQPSKHTCSQQHRTSPTFASLAATTPLLFSKAAMASRTVVVLAIGPSQRGQTQATHAPFALAVEGASILPDHDTSRALQRPAVTVPVRQADACPESPACVPLQEGPKVTLRVCVHALALVGCLAFARADHGPGQSMPELGLQLSPACIAIKATMQPASA